MEKHIITISREFGSGGRTIGKLVAEHLGIQFDALFTDDLYFRISRHADEMAYQIRDIFVSAGYPLLFDSPKIGRAHV